MESLAWGFPSWQSLVVIALSMKAALGKPCYPVTWRPYRGDGRDEYNRYTLLNTILGFLIVLSVFVLCHFQSINMSWMNINVLIGGVVQSIDLNCLSSSVWFPLSLTLWLSRSMSRTSWRRVCSRIMTATATSRRNSSRTTWTSRQATPLSRGLSPGSKGNSLCWSGTVETAQKRAAKLWRKCSPWRMDRKRFTIYTRCLADALIWSMSLINSQASCSMRAWTQNLFPGGQTP